MRRIILWAAPVLLALAACQRGVVYVPGPAEPPPVQPPPAQPPPPPPPQEPPPPAGNPPASVEDALSRLTPGLALEDATKALGVASLAPASGPAPMTARWFMSTPDGSWMVYARIVSGKVESAGATPVEKIP